MLVPQHSVSRVRNKSSVCQIPNLKFHFLSFSKHLSLLPIKVKNSALGQMLLNWYFPGESIPEDPGHSRRREDIAFSVGVLVPFTRPAPTSHAMFYFSVVVVWEQCISSKLFILLVWVFAVSLRRTEADTLIFIPLGYSFQERNLSYSESRKDTYWLIQDEKLLFTWLRLSHIPGTGFCVGLKIAVKGTSLVLAGVGVQCIFQGWNSEEQRRSV